MVRGSCEEEELSFFRILSSKDADLRLPVTREPEREGVEKRIPTTLFKLLDAALLEASPLLCILSYMVQHPYRLVLSFYFKVKLFREGFLLLPIK